MQVKVLVSLLIASAILFNEHGAAEQFELIAKPNKCVALRKGEACYESIVLLYSAPKKSNFCLLREGDEEPLACWKNKDNAKYQYRLASNTSILFQIIDEDESIIADTTVNVVWVYRQSRKRNRWRLF